MAKAKRKFIYALDFCEAILNRADTLSSSIDERRVIAGHKDSLHQLKNICKQSIAEPSFDFKSVIKAQTGD